MTTNTNRSITSTRNNSAHLPTKVVLPCVLSFANIWNPKSINGSEEKYSVSCVFSKEDVATLEKVKNAIKAAIEDGKTKKWGGKAPANLKTPLRDGDTDRPDDETYHGCFFINATSKEAPQIVDRRKNTIFDQSQVYSGCYCNVSVNFFPFNANGNRGVAAGLGNIQLITQGERLSGRSSANDDFDDLGEGENNDFTEVEVLDWLS